MRFDGVRFEQFALRQRPEVDDRIIRSLYRDRRDRLWIARRIDIARAFRERVAPP